MRGTLVITIPADDLSLLTVAERRRAAGIAASDDSRDVELEEMDIRVAAAIAAECNIAVGSGGEPTLHREFVEETIIRPNCRSIYLRRRHEILVASVTVDGAVLDGSRYEVDPESGLLCMIDGWWSATRLVVAYDAGFENVPSALKSAAMEAFTAFWREEGRDPYVKGTTIEIPDVETVRTDMWSGALPGQHKGAVPPGATVHLSRFRNWLV